MYFYCEEYEGSYLIFMTEKFYNYTKPYFQQHSFYNIFPSLFNLPKEDFYKYVETTFGAKIISGKYFKTAKIVSFPTKESADIFCKELNNRFSYCVSNNFFQ